MVQGTALYVGAVLGTGVLALPAIAARVAGPASLLAWGGLLVLSVPLAATFAALGARFPDAGGVSTYVRRAFGGQAAAMTGWWFYLGIPFGAPAGGMFAGSYVAAATGGGRTTVLVVAAALIAASLVANVFGLRVSGRLQLGLAGILMVLLALACALSLPRARLANLRPFAPHGWLAVGSAAGLLVWSFAGWEAITHLAGEFQRPGRDLRRASIAALAVVGVLYLAVAASTVLVLGEPAGRSSAPVADLLAVSLGKSARGIAAVVAVVLTLGVMNAYHAAAAKLGAALGRDGALPGWLARGSQAGQVPRRSLAVLATLSGASLVVIAATGIEVGPLVRVMTASIVAVYAIGMAAAIKLLEPGTAGRRVAVVALVAVGAMVVATGPYLAWPAGLSVAALAYLRRRANRRRGAQLTGKGRAGEISRLRKAT
jgi:amino acid efflux transporter